MNYLIHSNECNYYEYVLTSDISKYDMGKKTFFDILTKMALENHKCFEKKYKEYIVSNNITCHNYENKDIKIYTNKALYIENKDKYIIIGYNKTKQTILNYPSTNNIYVTNYIKKLIFRVTNRIYINFEICLQENKKKLYKIYINYNHDNNVDTKIINQNIDDLLKIITK